MANLSLRDYLSELDKNDCTDILKTDVEVPQDFIVTALALTLEQQKKFPVLYFSHVSGSHMPILANIFSDRERIARILGCNKDKISQRWAEIEKNPIKPIIVDGGPVQEVSTRDKEVDVTQLPIMKHFETDAGQYVTSGILVAKDPDTGIRNLSFHRMQLKEPNKFGVSFHSRQHLFDYFQRAEKQDHPLEVAVIIGAHPALLLAASAKPGINVDEYEIAGAILGEPLELVKGVTVDVEYPAAAEIVLEGRILPHVREPEGPFAEYTGYSTSRSTENVLEVTAVCSRKDPIYLSVVPGPSSDHLHLMRVAKEASVLQKLQEKISWVRAISYPKSGVNFHCFLSMAQAPEGIARLALTLLFGLDPYPKLAVIVDDDVDVDDEEAVWWAVATRAQGDKDIMIIPKVFTSPLDPSSEGGMSAKVGIDATMKEKVRKEVVVCRLAPEHINQAKRLVGLK
ncbi:MAG: UbiD family decarboxylase [Dehalobacterium sp.]